jgi:hypothetical protein
MPPLDKKKKLCTVSSSSSTLNSQLRKKKKCKGEKEVAGTKRHILILVY